MALCDCCQKVDIRKLLLASVENEEDIGDGDIRHPEMKTTANFHNSIFSVRAGAEDGCQLCILVWRGCVGRHESFYGAGEEPTDSQLAEDYVGEIFLGTTLWFGDGHSLLPQVIVMAKISRDEESSFRRLCSLDVFAPRAHVPQDRQDLLALLSREVFEDSSSTACLAVGKDWLETCLRDHPYCTEARRDTHPLPTRVIDVGTTEKEPSLFVTRGQIGSWTALSYCWGGHSDFTLTKASFDDLQRGVPMSEFPGTLRDAIVITRALGIKYLWIDALCIFQDSTDDWTAEAPKMAEIYRNSLVTITATESPAVTSGILGQRAAYSRCRLPWKVPRTEMVGVTPRDSTQPSRLVSSEVFVCLERKPWYDFMAPGESYWASRGWTMQEELLASRILSYNSTQVSWECSTCPKVEAESPRPATGNAHYFNLIKMIQKKQSSSSDSDSQPGLTSEDDETSYDDRAGDDVVELRSFWQDIVTRYSQRNLDRVQDRLPAIGGLARCVQRELRDTYCAGLWRNNLVRDLLWYSVYDKGKMFPDYIGPSWSWVAVDSGLIKWKERAAIELAKILDVPLEFESTEDRYGRVKDGRLIISAPYRHLAAIGEVDQHNSTPSLCFQEFVNQVFEENDAGSQGIEEYRQQPRPSAEQHFAALQIVRGIDEETQKPFLELLLLESAADRRFVSSDGASEIPYRRIGQVSLREADRIDEEGRANYFGIGPVEDSAWHEVASEEEWPLKTITII